METRGRWAHGRGGERGLWLLGLRGRASGVGRRGGGGMVGGVGVGCMWGDVVATGGAKGTQRVGGVGRARHVGGLWVRAAVVVVGERTMAVALVGGRGA